MLRWSGHARIDEGTMVKKVWQSELLSNRLHERLNRKLICIVKDLGVGRSGI